MTDEEIDKIYQQREVLRNEREKLIHRQKEINWQITQLDKVLFQYGGMDAMLWMPEKGPAYHIPLANLMKHNERVKEQEIMEAQVVERAEKKRNMPYEFSHYPDDIESKLYANK